MDFDPSKISKEDISNGFALDVCIKGRRTM